MLIKEYRKLRNVSQASLAAAVGVTPSIISRYESGTVRPPINKLTEIAHVLGVTLDALLGDTVAPPTSDIYDPPLTEQINSPYIRSIGPNPIVRLSPVDCDNVAFIFPDQGLVDSLIIQADWCCELCGRKDPLSKSGSYTFLEPHHVIWMSNGGTNDASNIVVLCPTCHQKIHRNETPQDTELLKEAAAKHLSE